MNNNKQKQACENISKIFNPKKSEKEIRKEQQEKILEEIFE